MVLLSALFLGLALLLLLPSLADVGMALKAGLRDGADPRTQAGHELPKILILIPAHDEELLIERCLHSVMELDYPKDRYEAVVVADNCSDRTAELALRSGARALVRRDLDRRGKPWAIAWALEQLPLDRWEAVIILDADSRLDGGYLRALASSSPLEEKVVQGYNDVSNPEDSSLTRMAQVFSAARCLGMNELKRRAGMNVPLGNGFCIGRTVLQQHGWSAFSICEDWELYAIFTVEGVPIENQARARVYSQEARDLRQSASQRRRWASGKAAVLVELGPALARSTRIGVLQKLDGFAELTAPGPAVHLASVALLAPIAWIGLPGGAWLAGLFVLSLGRLSLYSGRGILANPQPSRALRSFLTLPWYAVWRLGVQVTAFGRGSRHRWVRTARHGEPSPIPRGGQTGRAES